jgi:hypothetical protein
MATQKALFPELEDRTRRLGPEGFRYEEDVVSEAEEVALVASLATLELKPFEFHGHLGNRRVTSFGLRYDFSRRSLGAADPFPPFLEELREKVAKFAGRRVDEFQQGGSERVSGGGWHRLAQGQGSIRCGGWGVAFGPGDDAVSTG